MKREDRQMLLIYFLVFIVIVLLIILTKVVISSVKKPESNEGRAEPIQKMDIDPYPNVNEECTFDVDFLNYNSLTQAGCENGYTRYNINNVIIDEAKIAVSVIYSDKQQLKTGLFINDKKVKSNIDKVENIKFGIFDNKLFILDKTNGEANALAFNSKGEEVYNLKTVLCCQKF